MGTYTRFYYTFILKDIPEKMAEIIDYMSCLTEEKQPKTPKHDLFKTERWSYMLFSEGDSHFAEQGSEMWGEFEGTNIWALGGKSYFKHYKQEIELFIDWIKPFIVAGSAFFYSEILSGNEFTIAYGPEDLK